MTVKVVKDYYIKRTPKLIEEFSKHVEIAREILKIKFSDDKINELFLSIRRKKLVKILEKPDLYIRP